MERASSTLTPELSDEYDTLWAGMVIRAEKQPEADALVNAIIKNQARYEKLSLRTGIPWPLIAMLHNMECGLSFKKHLHNGDPLSAKTVNVPAGRPKNWDPATMDWDDSAADALTEIAKQEKWTLAAMAFSAERYNGWGYRKHNVWTPYLWSFSNNYRSGKFVKDGVWSDTAISNQCGFMVLLRRMIERGIVALEASTVSTTSTAAPAQPASAPASEPVSKNEAPPPYPGRVIRQGSKLSDSVKAVQDRLNATGCGPIETDGRFGSDTENAVKLFQSRFDDVDDRELTVDGLVGLNTWQALFGRSTSTPDANTTTERGDLCTDALEVARSQIGVSEQPPGSNRGPQVDAYLRAVGLDPAGNGTDGYAWCVAFIYWCFEQAAEARDVHNPLPRTASVIQLWNKAGEEGFTRVTAAEACANPGLIEPGMVFFLSTGGGFGHAGLVISRTDTVLDTIEGNTNTAGSREGIGVFRKSSRRLTNAALLGFVWFDK